MRFRWIVAPALLVGAASMDRAAAYSLDFITSTWGEAHLQATLDPESTTQIEQGSSFALRIKTDTNASLLIVLLNADSKAQLLKPNRSAATDRSAGGIEIHYPDSTLGETLNADMPVGKAYIYVLASKQPLVVASADSEPPIWVPEEELGKQLIAAVSDAPDVEVAVRRIPIQVVAPVLKEYVTSSEFVQFYGVGTRSITNPDRGFAIQFNHDSAELTEWGRRQLDAVAEGMRDNRLTGFRFLIEGHTDDVGSDDYNMRLSDRRASTVTHYLNAHGVDSRRLKSVAKGKSSPAVVGTSEEARGQNRRVVIKRIDTPD